MTVGELYSLALQNNWGQKRIEQIGIIRKEFVKIDINYEPTIQRYAEIDAFSQGKLKDRPLSMSARNMGKNDLWIAVRIQKRLQRQARQSPLKCKKSRNCCPKCAD